MNITAFSSIPEAPVRSFQRTFERRIKALTLTEAASALTDVNAFLGKQSGSPLSRLGELAQPAYLEKLLGDKPEVFDGVRKPLGLHLPLLDPLRKILRAKTIEPKEVTKIARELARNPDFLQSLSAYTVYTEADDEDSDGITRIWTDYAYERYENRVMRWRPQTSDRPGGGNPPHGHGPDEDVLGTVIITTGEVEERLYDKVNTTSAKLNHSRNLKAGGVVVITKGLIHAVQNITPTWAESFHIYIGGNVQLGPRYQEV